MVQISLPPERPYDHSIPFPVGAQLFRLMHYRYNQPKRIKLKAIE
jgi:hypothetical protein